MKFFGTLIILFLAICATDNILAETKDIVVKPNEIVIETEGLACAYCAYGLEKKLKKLPFVGPNGAGNKGVLTDIKNQLITIAILPGTKINLGEVYFSVKSSGYDIISMHLLLSGNMEDKDGKLLLADSKYGYTFELRQEALKELGRNNPLEIKVHINKDELASLDKDKPINVIVDSISYPEKNL